MRCGLCNMEVKDWKIHTAGALHRKNLKLAADGEFGIASAGIANKELAREALDRMDEAFNELKKGLSGDETAEIIKRAQKKAKEAKQNG